MGFSDVRPMLRAVNVLKILCFQGFKHIHVETTLILENFALEGRMTLQGIRALAVLASTATHSSPKCRTPSVSLKCRQIHAGRHMFERPRMHLLISPSFVGLNRRSRIPRARHDPSRSWLSNTQGRNQPEIQLPMDLNVTGSCS